MFTVQDGWGSNPSIAMMRSDNLLDWEHSIIDLSKLYPEKFGNAHWVWAPQTFYDDKAKKYLCGINTDGGSYSRSVCIDHMYHNSDGTIKCVAMTTEGVNNLK